MSGVSSNRGRKATTSSKSITANNNNKNKMQDLHKCFDDVHILAYAKQEKKSPRLKKDEGKQEGDPDGYEIAGGGDDVHVNADMSEEGEEDTENEEEHLEYENRDKKTKRSRKCVIGNNLKHSKYKSADIDENDADETEKDEGHDPEKYQNEKESEDSGEDEKHRKQAAQKLTAGVKRKREQALQQRPKYSAYKSSKGSGREKGWQNHISTEFDNQYSRRFFSRHHDALHDPNRVQDVGNSNVQQNSWERWRASAEGPPRDFSDFRFGSVPSAPGSNKTLEANVDHFSRHYPTPQLQCHHSFTALTPTLSGYALRETATLIAFERDEIAKELQNLKDDHNVLISELLELRKQCQFLAADRDSQLKEKDAVIRYLERVAGGQSNLPVSTTTKMEQKAQQMQKRRSIDLGTNVDRDGSSKFVAEGPNNHPNLSGFASTDPTIAKKGKSSNDEYSINDKNDDSKSNSKSKRKSKNLPIHIEDAIIRYLNAKDIKLTFGKFTKLNQRLFGSKEVRTRARHRHDYLKVLREQNPERFLFICRAHNNMIEYLDSKENDSNDEDSDQRIEFSL